MDPMDDDVVPNAYGSGFDIVPSFPSGANAVQRHEQAMAETQQMLAAMGPQGASEVYQQVLNGDGEYLPPGSRASHLSRCAVSRRNRRANSEQHVGNG